jgi:hypothetical protein
MYRQVSLTETEHSVHAVYLYVLYGYENSDYFTAQHWHIFITRTVCLLWVQTESLDTTEVNPSKGWVENIQQKQWQKIRVKN